MRYKTRFSNNWYQSQVFISCLYSVWLDFRIKEKWFLDDIGFTPRMHILLVCSKCPKTIWLNRLHSLRCMLLACIECKCYMTVTCMHRLDINAYVGIICWLCFFALSAVSWFCMHQEFACIKDSSSSFHIESVYYI